MPATTMNMYINKTRCNIFSLRIYFNCIFSFNILFTYFSNCITCNKHTTTFNDFKRRYYFTIIYF